jgi:hypothetical protein
MRGWVCSLQCNHSMVLSSAELVTIFYSHLRLPEDQVPVFISPGNRVAQLHPGHWVPFASPLTNHRAMVEVS